MHIVNILHISDTHFGDTHWCTSEKNIYESLIEVIKKIDDPNLHIIITGDITYKGQNKGFQLGLLFFKKLLSEMGLKCQNIMLCPGNHDLIIDNFREFDKFSYSLRNDGQFLYEKKDCSCYQLDNIFYLGINSAYNLRHEYGCVNISELKNKLGELSELFKNENLVKIAFLHHHIINQFENDISVIRNSYELISLLDNYKFTYLIHGHQHFSQCIYIGHTPIKMFGARTFSLKEGLNGINHYEINAKETSDTSYIYLADYKDNGNIGGFKKIEDGRK